MTTSVKGSDAQEKPLSAEQIQVVDAVKTIYVAAAADDLAKFHSVIAPGFYIFDGGARFDGDTIMKLMKQMHEAGNRYEWHVTEPDVHVYGNHAWIAYVNRGNITDAPGKKQDQQWLESAFLEKQGGRWTIQFMHSTRVAPKRAPSPTK